MICNYNRKNILSREYGNCVLFNSIKCTTLIVKYFQLLFSLNMFCVIMFHLKLQVY